MLCCCTYICSFRTWHKTHNLIQYKLEGLHWYTLVCCKCKTHLSHAVKETGAESLCSSSSVPCHRHHMPCTVPHLSECTHIFVPDARSCLISPCSRINASSDEHTGLQHDERANKLLLTRCTDKKQFNISAHRSSLSRWGLGSRRGNGATVKKRWHWRKKKTFLTGIKGALGF